MAEPSNERDKQSSIPTDRKTRSRKRKGATDPGTGPEATTNRANRANSSGASSADPFFVSQGATTPLDDAGLEWVDSPGPEYVPGFMGGLPGQNDPAYTVRRGPDQIELPRELDSKEMASVITETANLAAFGFLGAYATMNEMEANAIKSALARLLEASEQYTAVSKYAAPAALVGASTIWLIRVALMWRMSQALKPPKVPKAAPGEASPQDYTAFSTNGTAPPDAPDIFEQTSVASEGTDRAHGAFGSFGG